MAGPQFHETGYGRRFFDAQLPTLIETLGAIAHELKRINEREDSHEAVVMDSDHFQISKLSRMFGHSGEDEDEGDALEFRLVSDEPVILGRGAPIVERNGFWLGQEVHVINQKSLTGHDVHQGVIAYLGIDDVQVVIRANEHETRVGMIKVPYGDLKTF